MLSFWTFTSLRWATLDRRNQTKQFAIYLITTYEGIFSYSLFHKTLPKPGLQMHWISVRFYELGDRIPCTHNILQFLPKVLKKHTK